MTTPPDKPGKNAEKQKAVNEITTASNNPGTARKVFDRITGLQKHLSGRLRKKMVSFDQRIAAFRQRRWP